MTSLTLDRFRSLKNLPSLPEQIDNVLMATETSSSMDYSVVEMIQYDPAMAMAVLKVANTPIYGYPEQISSLQQAAGLLGPGAIKNIILRTPIIERFSDNSSEALPVDYLQLWIHSGVTAAVSGGLGRFIGGMESDVSFTSGLIHDAGIIALTVYFPTAFAKVQDFMDKNQVDLIEAEKQTLGFSHLEVAGELIEAWGLPPQLSQVIRHYAAPTKNNAHWEITAVVALAKSLACEWGFPSGLKGFAETKQENLLDLLGISAKELQKWEPELKKYAEFSLDTMKIP
ncbi:MAG: HDOD domain-containing protein [Nitrospinae bacterium]|nr:HDOD domain-containing protein [Nitrospinota bacterium]MBL7020020.1 HDOD domain-containing protein [Nitrospinaceae bacterium]